MKFLVTYYRLQDKEVPQDELQMALQFCQDFIKIPRDANDLLLIRAVANLIDKINQRITTSDSHTTPVIATSHAESTTSTFATSIYSLSSSDDSNLWSTNLSESHLEPTVPATVITAINAPVWNNQIFGSPSTPVESNRSAFIASPVATTSRGAIANTAGGPAFIRSTSTASENKGNVPKAVSSSSSSTENMSQRTSLLSILSKIPTLKVVGGLFSRFRSGLE